MTITSLSVDVIPGRGGSKRVLLKNIRGTYGRPLIEWSITTVWESGAFDRVVISTDGSEIAQIST